MSYAHALLLAERCGGCKRPRHPVATLDDGTRVCLPCAVQAPEMALEAVAS